MNAPGKFQACRDPEVGKRLYELTMEGAVDDQFGSVDEGGWYGLIADAIVSEDSNGFFDYRLYETEADARRAFDEMAEAAMAEVE